MATNFGSSATEAPIVGSNVSPKEGVVTQIPQQPVFLEGLTNIFDAANEFLTNKKKSDADQFVADFTAKQLLVADALAQGNIKSSAHARTLMRKNLLDALESNPSLAGTLIEAQKAITGLPGGAKIVEEGTDEEQRRTNLANTLSQNGLIAPGATDAEIDQGINEFRRLEALNREHSLKMQTLDEQLKSDQLSDNQRSRLQNEKKVATRKYATEMAQPEFKRVKNEFQKILDGPGTEAEKIVAIQDLYSDFKNQAAEMLVSLDSTESSALFAPFEMLFENYQERIKGTISDEEIKRNNERIIQMQTNLALQDPTIANLAVTSKMFGDAGFQQVISKSDPKVLEAFLNFVAGTTPGQDVPPASPYTEKMSEREGLKQGLNAITRGVLSSDPDLRDEATQRMQLVLNSVEDYEGLIRRNPKAGIELVNWMSSSSFLKALQSNPEAFGDLSVAQDILNRHYADEVWGMVDREFRNNKITIPQTYFSGSDFAPASENTTMETKEVVSVRSTGGGMEFFTESRDPLIVEKVRELNKELKPIINTTVKAMAHLDGNTNYRQLWENAATDLLGGGLPQDIDPTDNLSLDSFKQDVSALDTALETGGFVGSGSYKNAETAEEVAASFIGFTEQEHKDVLASFIKQTVGSDINPKTTAWCAAFMNAALGAVGKSGTNSFVARDFLNWGKAVSTPKRGDVVVFQRGTSKWKGHVGFYVGESANGNLLILGGNQDDQVSIKEFPKGKVLGYRRG